MHGYYSIRRIFRTLVTQAIPFHFFSLFFITTFCETGKSRLSDCCDVYASTVYIYIVRHLKREVQVSSQASYFRKALLKSRGDYVR